MGKAKHIYGLRNIGSDSFFYVGETTRMKERAASHKAKRPGVDFEMVLLETGGDEGYWIRKLLAEGHRLENKDKVQEFGKTVSGYFPKEVDKALREAVKKQKTSINEIVRLAAEEYLKICNFDVWDPGIGPRSPKVAKVAVQVSPILYAAVKDVASKKSRSIGWVIQQALCHKLLT